MQSGLLQQAISDSPVLFSPGVPMVCWVQVLPFQDTARPPPTATQAPAAWQETADSPPVMDGVLIWCQVLPFHPAASMQLQAGLSLVKLPTATQLDVPAHEMPDRLELTSGLGVGVTRQRRPFHAMPSLKSARSELLPVPPTARHSWTLGHATLDRPQKGTQPSWGVVNVRHVRPFHASETFPVSPKLVPTAMQNVVLAQATPDRNRPFSSWSFCQARPFHLSITLPTAMQNVALLQDTSASPVPGTPSMTRQWLPRHRCAEECWCPSGSV